MNNVKTVVTHNGVFHVDDVVAFTIIKTVVGEVNLIRTRDKDIIEEADIVLDVGGVYDLTIDRFDHHQKGGAGERENGIFYSTAGLTWGLYGNKFIRIILRENGVEMTDHQIGKLWKTIDDEIMSIDMIDNGQKVNEVKVTPLYDLVPLWNPSSLEETSDEIYMEWFLDAASFTQKYLKKRVLFVAAKILARDAVLTDYELGDNPELLVLFKFVPWQETVINELPDVKFVVFPDIKSGFRLQTIPLSEEGFQARKNLPLSWKGLRGEEFDSVTGVPGGVFCHDGRFICGHNTKEGIMALAELALKE